MKLSFDQIRELIHKELDTDSWIQELFDDKFIYHNKDHELFEVPYTIKDGAVSLGEQTKVEKKVEYVEVKSSVRLSSAEDVGTDNYGSAWGVQIAAFGVDKNKWLWTEKW